MTPDQIKLVQMTFAQVFPVKMSMATAFYERLFEIAPGVRPLFPENMVHQREKLTDMLAFVVRNLGDTETLVISLEGLARRHKGYKARPEHFGPVGEALIYALDSHVKGGLTDAQKEAWVDGYTLIVDTMSPLMDSKAA